jgi:tRNA pseudouridine55 synthase
LYPIKKIEKIQAMEKEYQKGKLLLMDKPLNWSSFDLVNYVRQELKRKAGIKDIKVGHAGTLDPLATGLVLICTGAWTKRIHEFQEMEKEYIGQMTLGSTTPSYDLETEPDATYPVEHITDEMIFNAAASFLGTIEQYPPAYSAIKIKGQRAYEYARKGQEVQIKPKLITIQSFDINHIEDHVVTFRVRCSKGTYIRSLANDFGARLQSGAHLSSLRRTAIGDYFVVHAITPQQFTDDLLSRFEI